jgi:hypothetical protein
LRLFGIRLNKESSTKAFTKMDLDYFIQSSIQPGSGMQDVDTEVKIFRNALDFSNLRIRDCMVHRTEIEAVSKETTTEEPAKPAEPTACYTAEQLAAMVPANATVTLEGDYAHFLTGTADTMTNPSITLVADEAAFTDIIVIKYRTNCGSYGSNFWGTLLLNGTAEFNGNRRDSDNWFYYATDGSWNVLILDMRKNKQGSEGTPDTDVTGGAAIESLVYNFFDYAGNDGKLTTADGGEEYFDIEYIAFFNTKEEAQSYAG